MGRVSVSSFLLSCVLSTPILADLPAVNDTTTSQDVFNVYTWKLISVTNTTGYAAQTFDVLYCFEEIGSLSIYIHDDTFAWGASAGLDAPYTCDFIDPETGVASEYINPDVFPTNNVLVDTLFSPTRFLEAQDHVVLAISYPDG